MTTTPLDDAHAAMDAAPEDDAARLRFFERLADSELFVLLTEEPRDENLSPEVFEVEDTSFLLAFDREDRLADFVGRPAPYAALPGRVIAGMLAGQGVGLGLNLDVAPSSMLLPAEALMWLVETLQSGPEETEARITEITPPKGLPEVLLAALDQKLARATGLASMAYLVAAVYDTGAKGHVLAFVDPAEGAEAALARAVSEALVFSGIEAGMLDVAFFRASDPMAARLAKVGLRYDLPQPEERVEVIRPAPGSDPDSPPILK